MGTQITRLTRLAAAGLSAVLLFATTACAATSPAETEPDNKTSVPAPTGPINVVASLNPVSYTHLTLPTICSV